MQRLQVWAIGALAVTLGVGSARGEVKVAVVAGSAATGRGGGDVTQLLTAGLQQEAGEAVVFVERQAIGRVMEEQKLAASGLVSAEAVVRVGRLVGADVFVVMESANREGAAGMVVFDVRSGARLADVGWGGTADVETMNQEARAALKAALAKRSDPSRTKTLAVLAVRNVNVPAQWASVCPTLSLLVQRRLVGSADVAVLERERLDRVNEEQALPVEGDVSSPLAAAALTLDLQVERLADGKRYGATARVSDPAGKLIGEVKVEAAIEERGVVALADALAEKLREMLKAAPTGKGDAAAEGKRFYAESEGAFAHQQIVRALAAAEAAYALAPGEDRYRAQLTHMLLIVAKDRVLPGKWGTKFYPLEGAIREAKRLEELPGALATARRALALREAGFEKQPNPMQWRWPQQLRADELLMDFAAMRAFEDNAAVAKESVPFREEFWKFLLRVRDASMAYAAAHPKETVSTSVLDYGMYLGNLNWAAPTAKDFVDAELPLLEAWWARAVGGQLPRGMALSAGAETIARAAAGSHMVKWTPEAYGREEKERLAAFLKKMEESSDAGAKGAAIAARGALKLEGAEPPHEVFLRAKKQFITSLDVNDASPQMRGTYQERIYDQWQSLLDTTPFPDKQQRGAEYLDILKTLATRKEASARVVEYVMRELENFPEQKEAARKTLLELDAVARREDAAVLVGSRAGASVEIQRALWKLDPAERKAEDYRAKQLAAMQGVSWGMVDGEAVLVAANNRSELEVREVSLATAAEKSRGKVACSGGDPHYVRGMCSGGGAVFVATAEGVAVFPAGGEAYWIRTADGLPEPGVSSLAWLEGVLYLGYGGPWLQADAGYLLAYHVKEKRCEIVASSGRQGGKSALENLGKFTVPSLVADPERHRVIAVVRFNEPRTPSGIYEILGKEGTARLLAKLDPNQMPQGGSPLQEGHVYYGAYGSLLAFDVAKETLRPIYMLYPARKPATQPVAGATTQAAVPEPVFVGDMSLRWPYCFAGDAFWSGSPVTRVPVSSKMPEVLRPMVDGGGRGVMEPWRDKLVLIKEGGVWVVERVR